MDNSEQRQIIEFIDNRIKTWWENSTGPHYIINGVQYSVGNFFLKGLEILNDHTYKIDEKLDFHNKQINDINQKLNINNDDIIFINDKVDKLSSENKNLELKYNKILKNLSDKISEVQVKFDNLKIENQKFKNEIDQLKAQISQQGMKPNSPIAAAEDNTIKIFNEWAKNPKLPLPPQFKFADGKLRLREKQEIYETNDIDSLWIINKSGDVKYLFPNPNAIDEIGGNIENIYAVTGTRKAKGQNKVKILDACKLKDGGFIEFKGELNLL